MGKNYFRPVEEPGAGKGCLDSASFVLSGSDVTYLLLFTVTLSSFCVFTGCTFSQLRVKPDPLIHAERLPRLKIRITCSRSKYIVAMIETTGQRSFELDHFVLRGSSGDVQKAREWTFREMNESELNTGAIDALTQGPKGYMRAFSLKPQNAVILKVKFDSRMGKDQSFIVLNEDSQTPAFSARCEED